MKRRIASTLIRLARRIDPNSAVDFTPFPPKGPAVVHIDHLRAHVEHMEAGRKAAKAFAREIVGPPPRFWS